MIRVCPFDGAPIPEDTWERHHMWHVNTLLGEISAVEESEYWTYAKEVFVSTGRIHRKMRPEWIHPE